MRKPRVIVLPAAMADQAQRASAQTACSLLAGAVDKLASSGAWPSDVGSYTIHVVPGDSVLTKSDPKAGLREPREQTHEAQNLRIEVGSGLPNSPAIAIFEARGTSKQAALAFILAHEIFHLGEAKRLRDCGIPASLLHSGFARAARPEMEADWRRLARDLAEHYKGHRRVDQNRFHPQFSGNAIRAHDTVSEGCADLLALRIMSGCLSDREHSNLRQAVIATRLDQEAEGSQNYQCGSSTSKILAARSEPSPEQIVKKTWACALGEIANALDATDDLRARAGNARLVLDHDLASNRPRAGFLGAVIKKLRG